MADPRPEPPTLTLVAFAAGLGGVTYLVSALVEYPSHWLGAAGTLAGLAALVLAQVLLAFLLYRNVRRCEDVYSRFFSRATLVALAAFVVLTVVILAPHGVALVSRELHDAAVLGARAVGVGA